MIEIPGYTIKGEIGQGGMASVFLAVQSSLDRQVALKVMAPALAADPTFTRRFLQEARTLASLAHPNIVQVFDVGVTSNQQHYFSMQYLAGGDFIARVNRGLGEAELKTVLNGVSKALGYAHHRGYVHRDVAPGNILFDAADTPILTDFGIALAASQATRITSTGLSVGTSHYMSPEQARGGDIDARSDLYSLGVLGYYGLIGKPPFSGADGFAVAYAHVFEPIPRLPEQFAKWQELFDRALAKDPKDRFSDVDEFMAALEEIPVSQAAVFNSAQTVPAGRILSASDLATPAPELGAAATVVNKRPEALKNVAKAAKPAAPRATRKSGSAAAAQPSSGRGMWIAVAVMGLLGSAALAAYFWPTGSKRPVPTAAIAASAEAPPTVATTAPGAASAAASVAPPKIDSTASTPPPSTALSAELPSADGIASEAASGSAYTSELDAPVDPGADPGVEMAEGAVVEEEFPTVEDPVKKLVALGRADLAAQRLTIPANSNALDRFKLALRIDSRDKAAKQGISDTARAYLGLGERAFDSGDLAQMNSNFALALEVAAVVPEAKPVAQEVAQRRAGYATPMLDEATKAASIWDKDAARSAYERALAIDPGNAIAQEGLRKLPSIGSRGFAFRDSLKDGSQGPDLVVLAGAKLAAGRYEVSRGDFRRFWKAAGARQFDGKEGSCRDRESFFRSSRKRNWENADITQEDSHPVVCVSWDEAAAFATWLSEQTGRRYRLLSNSEWDQLAREAGNGDCKAANLADAKFNESFDTKSGANCSDAYAATAPAGRFPASASGLNDVDGNVREWVNACGSGAPGAGCRDHLVRGRSWMSPADKEPANFSDKISSDVTSNTFGLRIARELGDRK